MLNIIKYDWLRRWKFFAGGLLAFLLFDIDSIYRIISKSNSGIISAVFFTVLFAMTLALFFDHIGRMYKCLFKSEGLLLFSLPINGYRFLGSKMLAVILECCAVALFVSCVLYIDYQILDYFAVSFIPDITIAVHNLPINFFQGLRILWVILLFYIGFLLMVNLSMVLVKSLFASTKHGILLSFIFFFIVTKVFSMLSNAFFKTTNFSLQQPSIGTGEVELFIGAAIIITFIITGYLLDRRINL